MSDDDFHQVKNGGAETPLITTYEKAHDAITAAVLGWSENVALLDDEAGQ